MTVIPAIPLKLRLLRAQRGLTQAEVAELSNVGVKAFATYEIGRIVPPLLTLESILAAYGLSLSNFFSWHPTPKEFERYGIEPHVPLSRKRSSAAQSDYPTPSSSLAWFGSW
jgi:transcriptional regulator with XRE-family HTH domain